MYIGVYIGAALPIPDVLSDVLQGLADPANMPRASDSVAPSGDHPSMLLVDPYRQALRPSQPACGIQCLPWGKASSVPRNHAGCVWSAAV